MRALKWSDLRKGHAQLRALFDNKCPIRADLHTEISTQRIHGYLWVKNPCSSASLGMFVDVKFEPDITWEGAKEALKNMCLVGADTGD